jgi:hypothetical protein
MPDDQRITSYAFEAPDFRKLAVQRSSSVAFQINTALGFSSMPEATYAWERSVHLRTAEQLHNQSGS